MVLVKEEKVNSFRDFTKRVAVVQEKKNQQKGQEVLMNLHINKFNSFSVLNHIQI